MKEHGWEIGTDAHPLGTYNFWVCRACGCLAGLVVHPEEKKPRRSPYVGGVPISEVSEDCDEAKKTVDGFVAKYPEWEEKAFRERRAGQGNRTPIVGLEGPGTANIPDPQEDKLG